MLPLLPQYTHIIDPKLKHIYLRFDDLGNLIIKSPKVSQAKIEQLLLKKSRWINNARERIDSKKGKQVTFSQESELYFLGTPYPLAIAKHEEKKTRFTFDKSTFTLQYHTYNETVFQKHIDSFYKQEAQAYIPQLVDKWSQKMQLHPSKISFRKTKRQWGSCSAQNALSFNTMMMKLPENVIEYIIVHELAHISHKHHQRPFWKLVERHMPRYKAQIAELKTYT